MTVPTSHIQQLRESATKVITGLHEMRQIFQEIEGFCLDWIDDADVFTEPTVHPVEKQEPEPEPERVAPTIEEVREILAALAQAGKADKVRELLAKHGAEKLSAVPTDQRQALINEAVAIR